MSGSFNNHARKVRNSKLPMGRRAFNLRSAILQYCYFAGEPSHSGMVEHLSNLVGGDLARSATESQLLDALNRLELARNRILEIRRAYDIKRIRAKLNGRRVPSNIEGENLAKAIEAAKQNAGMLPSKRKRRWYLEG